MTSPNAAPRAWRGDGMAMRAIHLPPNAGPCPSCGASLVFLYGTEEDADALDMAHPTPDAALLCDKIRGLRADGLPARAARVLILGHTTGPSLPRARGAIA